MKYRKFIEDNFLIDEPKAGQLVPFKFRPVQERYYNDLNKQYGIEKNGLDSPAREIILKARREGFTSLILALFAADDLVSEHPTESMVISYKDDATKTFRKRYRLFITSCIAKKIGINQKDIPKNPQLLEEAAKIAFRVDSEEFQLKHNRAKFYCGTASARVGGRGGVLQKLLFSEAAFYPDKKEFRAREIIEGTMRQVDIASGWIFAESTANGDMNHFAKMWKESQSGSSRFIPRFFSWKEFYTPEQFEVIKSEFTDKRLIPQEYPNTPEEAFLSSGDRFFDPEVIKSLPVEGGAKQGNWIYYLPYKPGHRYAIGCDVSEGVKQHNSTIVCMDFDAQTVIGGKTIKVPKVAALYASNEVAPDLFAYEIQSAGNRYGNCIVGVERNNHGFATLSKLKEIYFNIYEAEDEKLGWHTNYSTKPRMMHELRSSVHDKLMEISDNALKMELLSYPSLDLNVVRRDEQDETEGHFDRVIGLAICWQMRSLAQPSVVLGKKETSGSESFDKHEIFGMV